MRGRNMYIELVHNASSLASEAYKTLRSNIQFSNYGKELKVLSVTSSNPSEGKTTTSLNLVISFAQIGKKVLLIDADMRKPQQHKKLNIRGDKGLSTLLSGQDHVGDVIQHVKLEDGTMIDVIPAGIISPNPSEMLSAPIFKQYVDKFAEVYDLVLIDTPPVLSVTDSQIVAQLTDATILVIDQSKTKRTQLVETKNRLSIVGANLIGTVLNNVESGHDKYYYYYYQEDEKSKKKR